MNGNPIDAWLVQVETLETRPHHLRDVDINDAIKELDDVARANVEPGKTVEQTVSEYRNLAISKVKEKIRTCESKERVKFYEQVIALLSK